MASAEVNTANQTQPIFWNHLGNWIRLIPRSAVLSMIGPSLLLLIGYFGWRFYGAKSYDAAFYGLRKENLVLTQPPVWLKDSICLCWIAKLRLFWPELSINIPRFEKHIAFSLFLEVRYLFP